MLIVSITIKTMNRLYIIFVSIMYMKRKQYDILPTNVEGEDYMVWFW